MSGHWTDEWKRLPWLLTRKQVRQITGLTDEEIDKARSAGLLNRHVAGGRKGRYFKMEVMRICRIEG